MGTPAHDPKGAPLVAGSRSGRRALLFAAFLGSLTGAFVAGAAGFSIAFLPAAPATGPARQAGPAAVWRVGMWVRQETVADPAGARAAVRLAVRAGVNTLFVQVLQRGEAAYRSSIWPSPASSDPLGALLAEAERAGLEVAAWITVYPWGRLDGPPADPNHPLVRHPEWVTVDRWGRSLWRYRVGERAEVNGLFVDPGIEGVRRTIVETVLEIARRYDVHGIQLDYVRYPGRDLGYHPLALSAFWERWEDERAARGPGARPEPPSRQGEPARTPVASLPLPHGPDEMAAWGAFRAEQVTRLVQEVSQALNREGRPVALSAAVIPDAARARDEFAQDWAAWLEQGLLDEAVLMSYTKEPARLSAWVRQAVALAGGRPVLAGIAAYQLGLQEAHRLAELVEAARAAGASGVVYFSFESIEGRPDLVEASRRALSAASSGAGRLR